jgi:WD40 repeat protein
LLVIVIITISAGGGGPVFVSYLDSFGKVEPGCAVLNGHKSAVTDISFSPFHSGLLASGSLDGTIKVLADLNPLTNSLLTHSSTQSS